MVHYSILIPQVSSDIIKRCCAQISLDNIFDGYVERSRKALEDSIHCCVFWKEAYAHVSKVHDKFSLEGWVLDEHSIFAEVDGFIQRCKDLLEVVEGQVGVMLALNPRPLLARKEMSLYTL